MRHAFGDAGEGVQGWRGSGDVGEFGGDDGAAGESEVVEFFGELGVAEEKAEGGAEVVELFGGDAGGLRVAGGVEGGVLAVEEEELAVGGVVGPAHAAGFAEGEGAGFGAVEAEALVALGVVGLEGGEVVVVVVDDFS